MSRTLRRDVFDPETIGVYHCFNRIVRRSFLCGYDSYTGKDYSYRREWLYQRLKYLAGYFAIDVLAYAILSNHYHLVLRNRPDEVEAMDDRTVVKNWLRICPKSQKQADGTAGPPTEPEIQYELKRPGRVAELRNRLSNPSWLIRQLSQYMGIRCNAEDEVTGHFWESRFGMTRLLDEEAVLACLAYVDLNPIRAHLIDSLEDYPYVSIGERLRTLDDRAIDTSSWLTPIALAGETSGGPVTVAGHRRREELAETLREQTRRPAQPLGCLPIGLEQYAELLRWLAGSKRSAGASSCGKEADGQESARSGPQIVLQLGLDPKEFAGLVNHFGNRFYTAAGSPASLRREAARRGKRRLNGPGRHALERRRCPAAVP